MLFQEQDELAHFPVYWSHTECSQSMIVVTITK